MKTLHQNKNSYKQQPNESGYFGNFGGRYVSETLMPLIQEVEKEYNIVQKDKKFINELNYYLVVYTPILALSIGTLYNSQPI